MDRLQTRKYAQPIISLVGGIAMSPRRERYLRLAARQPKSPPARAIDRPKLDMLLGYTTTATSYAKACNNFWKLSALIIFVGLAGFPAVESADSEATAVLFGTKLSLRDYSTFGSLFLLLIMTPFADAQCRYFIIKSTIDTRLVIDGAYESGFVTQDEAERKYGKQLSSNPLFRLMTIGSAFTSLSETTYANFTATNHSFNRITEYENMKKEAAGELAEIAGKESQTMKAEAVKDIDDKVNLEPNVDGVSIEKKGQKTSILDKIRNADWHAQYRNWNWQATLVWYTYLPVIGAVILAGRTSDKPLWFPFAMLVLAIFAFRSCYSVYKLHGYTMEMQPIKSENNA